MTSELTEMAERSRTLEENWLREKAISAETQEKLARALDATRGVHTLRHENEQLRDELKREREHGELCPDCIADADAIDSP